MNILLLNHYAGSPKHGMEYRPYYLSREWCRLGHKVQIVASAQSHVRANQPDLAGKDRLDETIDGIHYTWFQTPAYSGNGLGRVRNIASFVGRLYRDGKQLVQSFQPDVVVASSTYPMDIWPARRIAKMARAKLVFEVHDLWPLSPIELGGMSPRHPFIQLCQRAENTAYRDSDIVVSMLPKVHEHMAEHGLDLSKLHIIPNGISLDDWSVELQPISGELENHIRFVRSRGNMIVGYAGSHGLPNALDTLLDAATLLKDQPAGFVLVGDGHEKARLQQRVEQEGLKNVRMFPPIPKAQIPSFLHAIDIAFIGWQQQPIYRFGIAPNKLMDYMIAGCSVLHAVKAGNDPVAEAGCGLTVPPESPQAIAKAVNRFIGMTHDERESLGAKGKTFVLANHDYKVLAQRFLDIIR
jgi:glycosyltransferase involved in cell wall biosynthesis